ncbi:hypothetical protein ACOSQ2_019965 [Xanthoceras sorbifolium]
MLLTIRSVLLVPRSSTTHFCQKQFSQYTCPRCNSRYYILPTFSSLLYGQVNFEDLSAYEKKLFQRAMASGELSKDDRPIGSLVQGTQLIQLVSKQEASVPSDEDLVSNESSIHLVDIIYSYCFTLRVYNGDWQSDALGSAMMVLTVSSVLDQGRQPETIREALSYCLEQTCSSYKHHGWIQPGEAWSSPAAILMAERISFTDHGGRKSSVKTDVSKAESRGKITIEEMK